MNDGVKDFKVMFQLVLCISIIYFTYLLFSKLVFKLLEKPENRKKYLYYILPVNEKRLISILEIKPTESQQFSRMLLLLSILSIFALIALECL